MLLKLFWYFADRYESTYRCSAVQVANFAFCCKVVLVGCRCLFLPESVTESLKKKSLVLIMLSLLLIIGEVVKLQLQMFSKFGTQP